MSSPVSFAEPDNAVNMGATCIATFLQNELNIITMFTVARFTDPPLLVYCLFHTPIPKILCGPKFLRFL